MLQTRVAAAGAQARAGDADHRRARRGLRAHALTDLGWTESFLLGALLSPTDPVLSSSVVTNPRVPRARPPFAQPRVGAERRPRAARRARVRGGAGAERERLRVVALRAPGRRRSALAFGDRRSGSSASWLLPRGRGAERGRSRRTRSRCTRSASRSRPTASTVALPPARQRLHRRVRVRDHARDPAPRRRATLRAARRGHRRDRQARHLRRVRLAADVRRPVRRRLGRRRHRRVHAAARAADRDLDRARRRCASTPSTKGFMAWFGPKGVATMTFSLLVLGRGHPGGRADLQPRRAAVFASILAARPDRHARHGMARPPHRGASARHRADGADVTAGHSTGVPSGRMTSQRPPNSVTSWQSARPGESAT